jgi:outer membrane protein TolC
MYLAMKQIIVFFILALGISFEAQSAPLTLEEYLTKVKSSSKDIKLAEQELEVAKANNQQAWSLALPKISVEGTYNRNLKDNFLYADFSAMGGGSGTQKFKINRNNEFGLRAGLSQTLFSLEVGSALRAASEYEKMTKFIYESSEQQILTVAKKLFYQTLLLKKVWEVSGAAEENAYKNFLNIKKKFDNGVVSEFELLQAEVRWKDQIPQTAEAKRNMDIAMISLKNLASIDIKEQIELTGNFEKYPAMPAEMAFETVLDKRPDYNALVWEEKLRSTNVTAERSNFFPNLTASFAYNYTSQSDEFKLEEENNALVAGLTLTVPIYTGGFVGSQVEKAIIDRKKTKLQLQKTTDDIYQEVSQIWLRLDEAKQRIESSNSTLQTAKKAFEIAEISNQQGLATQLELKDSRVAFDQAKLTYYSAVFDYLSAYFDWQQATGDVSIGE